MMNLFYSKSLAWCSLALVYLLFGFFAYRVQAQPTIVWQQNIGTNKNDKALDLFNDDEGHFILIGSEPHQDFTGQYRNYLTTIKMDPDGHQLWKTYHDVAFETFNPPVSYTIGGHFTTEEYGQRLICLVVTINNQNVLIKLEDSTGLFFTYEIIGSAVIDVKPNNDKIYAIRRCSSQPVCYGPDSLIVERYDPTPDSIIFNPVQWTYGLKQNLRTASIQGHYDFDPQEIKEDALGNVYLLVQIERWDFQFCTDCNAAFVDAWCEVFKISPQGELLKHKRIVISKAVVSTMHFVAFESDEMIIRVDDINAANTAVISTLYYVDSTLNITRTVKLDRQYAHIAIDGEGNFTTCTGIISPFDPNGHGATDVLVSKLNALGQVQWTKYLGGSDYDWPNGMVISGDQDIVFLASSGSHDFDVTGNLGKQDMWLVKLAEQSSSTSPFEQFDELEFYPNPVTNFLHFDNAFGEVDIDIVDLKGHVWRSEKENREHVVVNVSDLVPGNYFIHLRSKNKALVGSLVKM